MLVLGMLYAGDDFLMTPRRPMALAMLLMALVLPSAAHGQEADDEIEQLVTDLDALIIGTQVTTRCALFDSSIEYLTPLEVTGAEIRKRELETALSGQIENFADQVSEMRAEANAIPCGSQGLVPFLDFNRQIARDVRDIALVAWQSIEIEQCAYFVDDGFLAAVERAKAASETLDLSGDPARATYVEETGAAWAALFADNCFNLGFEPTQTLPGLIALALPADGEG